ncbi:murein biosynthesis integral membrane protein MurJ [Cohnella soli]|uniref:Lipid II flippase n=1 Tax=Cohnella soli TaxID=425005 RepID=A0ABW0I172_9BACL
MNAKAIFSGAAILFVGNLLSSFLGLGREILSAAYYGAGMQMDAYLFANTLPSIVLSFFGGILMGGFIPLFIKKRVENEEEASAMFSNAMNWVIVIVLALTAVFYALSDPIASLFSSDAESHRMIERLLWILLPSILFFGLTYAQSAVLNSLNHFVVPALLTVLNNIVVIGFMVFFHKSMGIDSVALGFVVGTVLQVIVQWPMMRKKGIRYRLRMTWKDEQLKRLVFMSFPIIGLVLIDQCIVFSTRFFASYLEEGSISAINYANRFIMLPVTLFGTALISATYPTVVTLIAENKKKEYNEIVSTTVKSLLLMLLPVAVTCMVFAPNIIRLLLERGAFDKQATEMTSSAFLVLAIGIFIIPIREFFIKLFFGKEKMRTPIYTSLIYMSSFIVGCFLLIPSLHYMGIAIATAIGMVCSLTFLIVRYLRMDGGNRIGVPVVYIAKVAASAGLAAGIARLLYESVSTQIPGQWEAPLSVLAICCSVLMYLVFIRWFGIREIHLVIGKITARFSVRKSRTNAAVGEG